MLIVVVCDWLVKSNRDVSHGLGLDRVVFLPRSSTVVAKEALALVHLIVLLNTAYLGTWCWIARAFVETKKVETNGDRLCETMWNVCHQSTKNHAAGYSHHNVGTVLHRSNSIIVFELKLHDLKASEAADY